MWDLELNNEIVNLLLKDRVCSQNIIWASGSNPGDHILNQDIIKIKPRFMKSKDIQSDRQKNKGEVFTPIKTIKDMIDVVEENIIKDSKSPLDYINKTWLEITCGEGHFITTRYDSESGEYIELDDRVGLLDRKLNLINSINEFDKWYNYITLAYKNVYGYEYQGDSLLISRYNLLMTFIENFKFKWESYPELDQLLEIVDIISWNIWQMDGLTHTIPYREEVASYQLNLFTEREKKSPVDAQIKNWKDGGIIKFKDLIYS